MSATATPAPVLADMKRSLITHPPLSLPLLRPAQRSLPIFGSIEATPDGPLSLRLHFLGQLSRRGRETAYP